jgi:hypothetical protein
MLPDLQGAILCEDVRQEMSGTQTLVGVVNAIPTPTLPVGVFRLCLWARWCGGTGTFTQRSRIVAPDDQTLVGESSVQFTLRDVESHATNVHYFNGLQFRDYGIHHIEVLLGDELRMRFPVAVIRVAPPNQQA